MSQAHDTVLLEEAVAALVSDVNACYVDGTFGRGGHARAILDRLSPTGKLFAVDRDPEAVAAGLALAEADSRLQMLAGGFADMPALLRQAAWQTPVQGVLLDLGVSSPQLDQAARGFSFMRDGALDMRMDPTSGISAAQWLAEADERDIVNVLRTYGEERFAKRIARAIVEARSTAPLTTTHELAALVAAAIPVREPGKHPATRSFQAIRIHINDELGQLQRLLAQVVDLLAVGGRLVVISFHSLEDRIVKRFMRDQSRGEQLPRYLPVRDEQRGVRLRLVGAATRPGDAEVARNPRARSAVMRVAERIA